MEEQGKEKALFGRRRARAQALQLLFQVEINGYTVAEILAHGNYALEDGPLDPYASQLALDCFQRREEFDRMIDNYSDNWNVERLSLVDKTLIRMALAELDREPALTGVVVDEVVELAKRYSKDDSYRYVNGILGKIMREEPLFKTESMDKDPFGLATSEDDTTAANAFDKPVAEENQEEPASSQAQ